ncbi:Uncharacterised protein [Achromobacter sp. 2789STDY5608615]|nr:Uncharacterised protein [Achromobacter sp. 2789STDY5608615]
MASPITSTVTIGPNASAVTSGLMTSAARTRGPISVLARQRRAASSQPSSRIRFQAAMIRLATCGPPSNSHQLNARSPSHRARATLLTTTHGSQTAWLVATSAQGSSRTAHQANNSQVSAPVW